MFSETANQITGRINSKYSGLTYYLSLKRTNDSLAKANERLYNVLKENYQVSQVDEKIILDSIKQDSTFKVLRYKYLVAQVVSNSVSSQNNYIVVNRGSNQGVRKDMGVIDANNAVVGIVTEVSGDYAVILSLLHKKDSKVSSKLFAGNGEVGTTIWNGEQPNMLNLEGIPKSAQVKKGDSVITSGYSTFFPKGLLVGRVEDVKPEKSSNNFQLKIKSAADFYNLQFVYLIDNMQQTAINDILKKAEKAHSN